MYAVGVDVSKGRSTVAVLRSQTDVVMRPFDVTHDKQGLAGLVDKLNGLGGDVRVVMEHTGVYYESIANVLHNAGLFVSAVNPLLIRNYDNNSLRKIKTDKADAKKIASYALDNWESLREYSPMDDIRYKLRTLNRQFQLASANHTALSNNLIALTEQCWPGVRDLFSSPARSNGSQKWVDFLDTFWHVDCVSRLSLNAFTERYRNWCGKHGYNFKADKAAQIHAKARSVFPLISKDDITRLLVKSAVAQLNAVSKAVEELRAEMNRVASMLPEYETVMSMTGVGESMGPQLMAEIGDIRRFPHMRSIVAYAGTDPGRNDSGDKVSDKGRTTKRGSPYLRKTLFVIMTILMQLQSADDPVYQFLDKKRSEDKPYYVYMTAGAPSFCASTMAKSVIASRRRVSGTNPRRTHNVMRSTLVDRGWKQPLDCHSTHQL